MSRGSGNYQVMIKTIKFPCLLFLWIFLIYMMQLKCSQVFGLSVYLTPAPRPKWLGDDLDVLLYLCDLHLLELFSFAWTWPSPLVWSAPPITSARTPCPSSSASTEFDLWWEFFFWNYFSDLQDTAEKGSCWAWLGRGMGKVWVWLVLFSLRQ